MLLDQTLRPEDPPGMLCGGWQRIALVRLGGAQRAMVERLSVALAAGERCGWQLSESGWEAIAPGMPLPEPVGVVGEPGWRHVQPLGPTLPAWFHAPMGLPIGSHTPAEIALSIAAEMVAVRARPV